MTTAKQVDTLIHSRWLIPMEGPNTYLENQTLVIDQGVIENILPTTKAKEQYQSQNEHNLTDHALIPGLVNCHGHAAMTLLRGYADDLPLMEWLQNYIWPCEQKHVGPKFVQDGTKLAIAEMIKGGTTCFSDNYFFPDVACQVANQAGIRSQICFAILNIETAWAKNVSEYINKGMELLSATKDHALSRIVLGPHSPYALDDQSIKRIVKISEKHNLPVQMHIHESATEVNDSLKQFSMRPIQRLTNLGLINERLQAVHMTQLNEDEILQMAKAKVSVIHCPESNLKLGNGFSPIDQLIKAGVNVAIGTDGCASNNDLDMLGETRTASLLAKGFSGNTSALDAHKALHAATLSGAKAMGIDSLTGSLIKGKQADITAIDLSHIACQPLFNPISQIIYSTTRDQVSHVWVAGKKLLDNKELTTIDESELRSTAQAWHDTIINSN